jgi:hypothetical protein
MSEPVDETTPRRFRRLAHGGPLRLLMPWVCMVVGIGMVVRGLLDVQVRGDALFVFLGSGLFVLALVVLLVNRWQEHRGL